MDFPLDGSWYFQNGEKRHYQIRPCGYRHSLRLICKMCSEARSEATVQRNRNPITPDLRGWIFKRDEHKCVECDSTEDLTVDHVTPVILGGKTDPDNLQTLCRPCNSSKGSK